MFERFGKSSEALMNLKQDFFNDNDNLLKKSKEINNIYISQPRRDRCKNCDYPIKNWSFTKQKVEYSVCEQCGHLNGLHQDTSKFCEAVYTDDGGTGYAENYNSKDIEEYNYRVSNIYLPKAEFLCDSLRHIGEVSENLSYSDFGAGTGFFVNALLKTGNPNVTGYEVSEAQVSLGNGVGNLKNLVVHSMKEIVDLAASVNSEVVSMIGVLEHLQNPREVLNALRNNSNVHYFYLSVPLFSPCVFFEMVFPTIMQRHLTSGHTHLYTESSLEWMANEYDLEPVSAWWFGTDMVDLYRNIEVRMKQQKETKSMADYWSKIMIPLIDSMQSAIDEKHLSSEVHMLYKFKGR